MSQTPWYATILFTAAGLAVMYFSYREAIWLGVFAGAVMVVISLLIRRRKGPEA